MISVRRNNFISLIINILIVIQVILAILSFYYLTSGDELVPIASECFRYFTIDSNIFLALTCLFIIPFNIRAIKMTKSRCTFTSERLVKQVLIPKWAIRLKFMGTCAAMLTFTTVVAFLGPIMGYEKMFTSGNLFLHLTCPILALLSFVLNDYGMKMRFSVIWLGVIPEVVYGLIYMYQILYAKAWPDFYSFNSGMLEDKWPFSLAFMTLGMIVISIIIYGLHRAFTYRNRF